MKIARIVSSNSHLDYVGRVIDALDAADPPGADDYGFAQFVVLPMDDGTDVVGVIYDSILVNPEYANFGPRLSPKPELASFSPDYLNEQGVLIGILLLGGRDRDGRAKQGVPRRVVPAGQEVFALSAADTARFHSGPDGRAHIHYYSQIVAHAGAFASPLLEAIIDELAPHFDDADRGRLDVIRQSLAWQRTMGGMRL